MPRDLIVGNGSLQVMFDAAYRLRDVYFPSLGKENHTGEVADTALSWSHAEFVIAVRDYLDRRRQLLEAPS